MKKKIKIIELDANTQYKIFTDYTDDKKSEFCLVRIDGDVWIKLLEETNTDIDKFKEQVQNLSKYFNANIYEKQPDEEK